MPLPPDYRQLTVLSDRPEGRVLRAERGGLDLVVRIEGVAAASEVSAELEVLAAVEHPGLVSLVDFGVLPDGRRFVARPFVEGADLAEAWAARPDEALLIPWLEQLLEALAALHRAGFAHGDLKPSNVLVDATGVLRLVDFGLARPAGDSAMGPAGGTLYYAAPELLLDAAPSPASDLFALGVLVHELLVGERRPAAEFYADFPRRGFLDAAGTTAERLPAWARAWVTRLLQVDPLERFGSAAEALRDLAERLGRPVPALAPPARPELAVLAGDPLREDWAEAALEDLLEGGARAWLALPDGEQAGPVARELGLLAARRGAALRILDLAGLAAACATAVELDEALAELAASEVPLLLTCPPEDAWARRAVELLSGRDGGSLAVLTEGPAPARGTWRATALPLLGRGPLEQQLGRRLEGDPAELAELARALVDRGATATAVQADLDLLVEAGALVSGERRPRLRGGAREVLQASGSGADGPDLSGHEAAALLALALVGAGPLAAAHLAGPDRARTAADLLERGLLERTAEGLVPTGAARAALRRRSASGQELGAAHAAEAARLVAAGGAAPELALQQVGAGADPEAVDLAERWTELREAGAPERVLAAGRRLTALLAQAGRALPPRALAEVGLAELATGAVDRAEEIASDLVRSDRPPEERALGLRLAGRVAELRHGHERALALFAEALELHPAAAGEVAVARANLLFAAGRLDELASLVAEAGGDPHVSPRQHDYLLAVEAMALLGRGRGERAAAQLAPLIDRAVAAGDRQREAALAANLATVHRRLGARDAALDWNRRALAAYREVGHLPGLALAQNQLGGLLREQGQLALAETQLSEAAELRGRLGDAAGRAVVRGTLGLLRASRGHAAAALEDLGRALAELDPAQLQRFGPLLRAAAARLHAALGRPREAAEVTASDPRVLLGHASAAVLAGDVQAASGLLQRARERARAAGDPAVAAEAAFLLANGLRPPRVAARVEDEASAPLVAEDRAVLELLLRPDADLDPTATADLVAELERRGRDDRAARLGLRLAAATGERAHLERARRTLDRCEAGLTAGETGHLRRSLLGFPDPRPDDLELLDHPETLDPDDMDLLRLLELNHQLVRQADQRSLLGTIVEEALAVTGAERGFLILEEDGILRLDVARDSSRGGLDEADFEVSGSIIQRSLEEGQALRLSDAVDDPLLGGAASVQALELRSVLCAPFPIDASLRGVIYLDNRLVRGAFDERAERLLGLLADQAALAIAQVRRREQIERLNEELEQRIEVRETELAQAHRDLSEAGLARPVGGLVGRSPAMQEVKDLIERVAPTELSVLVVGPSGSGKELAARALHDLSARAGAPFVSENCAAMPAALAEAELFGVRRGAYTGAERDRPGLFERAEGGTLFLDEIGEMPLDLQAKLLRALETRKVRPVGGEELLPVDFRLVAATNRDLEEEVESGGFRQDLLYRIRGIELGMPSLGRCREDLPELVRHFLELEAARTGEAKSVTPEVLERLVSRDWPGNVRELRNEVQRLHALSGAVLDDPELVRPAARAGALPQDLTGTLEQLERAAILAALERHGGDKRQAAAALGISRAKIYQRLKEWREGD